MKKILCVFLALSILAGVAVSLNGCGKSDDDKNETSAETEEIAPGLHGVVDTIIKEGGFDDSLVSGFVYKEEDDESDYLMLAYGFADITAGDYLEDYVLSEPTDYNQTIAIFSFKDGMEDSYFDEVIAAVTDVYINMRAESLKMYKPEEYAIMEWAIENPDLIWKKYDNALVLIIDGEGEAQTDFDAFESAAKINGII